MIAFFELGQSRFDIADLLAEFLAFLGQKIESLSRGLLALTQVFIEEQADQFVGYTLGCFGVFALIGQIEGDGGLHSTALLGIDDVGADRRDGDVFAHLLDDGFQRLVLAIFGVEIVFLDDRDQVGIGQYPLRDHLDALVGKARDHRAHQILWDLLLFDQDDGTGLVNRWQTKCSAYGDEQQRRQRH